METGVATEVEARVETAVEIGVENGVENGAEKNPWPGSTEGGKFHARDFRRQFYVFAREKIPRQFPRQFPQQFPRQFPRQFPPPFSTPVLTPAAQPISANFSTPHSTPPARLSTFQVRGTRTKKNYHLRWRSIRATRARPCRCTRALATRAWRNCDSLERVSGPGS